MTSTETDELRKKLKHQQYLTLGLFTIMFVAIAFLYNSDINPDKLQLKELTAGKINIAGPDSVNRIILTHDVGPAIYDGKEFPRNAPKSTAAIVYLDKEGNEVGGTAVGSTENENLLLHNLDYKGVPLEAIGLRRIQTEEVSEAALVIVDNPRRDISINTDSLINEIKTRSPGEEIRKLQKQMVDRVRVGVTNHNALLTFADMDGNERIEMGVDSTGNSFIKFLDTKGNVIRKIPE